MLKLGILCSGALGFSTLEKINDDGQIELILTDSNSILIIDYAKKYSIPYFLGNPREGRGFTFIRNYDIDVFISINYLFLIEQDIIDHSNMLTFNIHGSLLPKYRGRTPHVWAIINGEKKAGVTAHKINSGCDTGDVIKQIEIAIDSNDTGAMLLKKYEDIYYPLIKEVLLDLQKNKLRSYPQDEEAATYFPKRTPIDGIIDWQLPREQIRNWVRAQAYPYPGAYTYLDNQKIIIDDVSISVIKTKEKQENGEIVQTTPSVIVKTINGALKLNNIRTENCRFVVGGIFNNENKQ